MGGDRMRERRGGELVVWVYSEDCNGEAPIQDR